MDKGKSKQQSLQASKEAKSVWQARIRQLWHQILGIPSQTLVPKDSLYWADTVAWESKGSCWDTHHGNWGPGQCRLCLSNRPDRLLITFPIFWSVQSQMLKLAVRQEYTGEKYRLPKLVCLDLKCWFCPLLAVWFWTNASVSPWWTGANNSTYLIGYLEELCGYMKSG